MCLKWSKVATTPGSRAVSESGSLPWPQDQTGTPIPHLPLPTRMVLKSWSFHSNQLCLPNTENQSPLIPLSSQSISHLLVLLFSHFCLPEPILNAKILQSESECHSPHSPPIAPSCLAHRPPWVIPLTPRWSYLPSFIFYSSPQGQPHQSSCFFEQVSQILLHYSLLSRIYCSSSSPLGSLLMSFHSCLDITLLDVRSLPILYKIASVAPSSPYPTLMFSIAHMATCH
jgi:hypothetical protein